MKSLPSLPEIMARNYIMIHYTGHFVYIWITTNTIVMDCSTLEHITID